MATSFKLTDAKRSNIVTAIASASDTRGQMMSVRRTMIEAFKGAPAKPLDTADVNSIRDALVAEYKTRPTIGEKSVAPMASLGAKVATYMPILLALDESKFGEFCSSMSNAGKFCTLLKKHDGNIKATLAAVAEERKPDFAKSVGAHVKALLNMGGRGKWASNEARALIVAFADTAGIKGLGELGDTYRAPALARKAIGG